MIEIYEKQRAMRKMREAALQKGVVAILDIGTFKVSCLILRFKSAALGALDGVGSLGGQSGFRVIGCATLGSRGVKLGEIENMLETERAVRSVLGQAQKMANEKVDHVIACFSGARPRSYGLEGEVGIETPKVETHDIGRVLASCEMPDIGMGREVLHAQPINFALDGRSGLTDPRGQIGDKLTADVHMVTVDENVVKNIAHCVKRSEMELAGVAASSYASGLAALVEDEQELGAACIDLGGGTTSISVFIKKHMIHADTVRLGGEHVTADISWALQIPPKDAERIKTFHGGLFATGRDDREMIPIHSETGDWEHDRRKVSRSDLILIMRPRVEEILEQVREKLNAASFDALPSQQIVLTGGGSQMPGIDELAQRILGQQVRIGRPMRINGLPQNLTSASFSSVVGLALLMAHPRDEWWDFDMPSDRYASWPVKRVIRWIKDNW